MGLARCAGCWPGERYFAAVIGDLKHGFPIPQQYT